MDLKRPQQSKAQPHLPGLIMRLEWLVACAEIAPDLPTGGLVLVMRAVHDLTAWLDARRTQRPTLPSGVGPFLALIDPPTPDSLRAILAETRNALNQLRDLYDGGLDTLERQAQERTGQALGLIDGALKWVDEADRLLQ